MSTTNFDANSPSTIRLGTVYRKTSTTYLVHTPEQMILCGLAAKLRKADPRSRGIDPANMVTVGDQVHFETLPGGESLITAVLPRRNQLGRRSSAPMPTAHTHEQVFVSNVDQVAAVFAAANPAPKWNLLDRYLVLAESQDLPALVLLTKTDLLDEDDDEINAACAEYARLGYRVIPCSAVTGEGLDEARQALAGRTTVLVGKSGVGKTSLLNAVEPDLGLRVAAVSALTGKGRHTTTHLELFPLAGGGAVVDTPGIREFGLVELEQDDLGMYYPEIRPLLGRCRFGLDCRHGDEPGCAVRAAVERGQVSPRRFLSYLRLQEEMR